MTKLFCLPTSAKNDANPTAPNYAYIIISPAFEKLIVKAKEIESLNQMSSEGRAEIVIWAKRDDVHFVCDRDKDADPDIVDMEEGLYACDAHINNFGLRYHIQDSSESEVIISENLNTDDIVRYTDRVEQLPLRYFSVWNDGDQVVKTNCTMNSFNGQLDIEAHKGPTPEGKPDREYVADSEDNEYPIFRNEQVNDEMFVHPRVLDQLVELLSNKESNCQSM